MTIFSRLLRILFLPVRRYLIFFSEWSVGLTLVFIAVSLSTDGALNGNYFSLLQLISAGLVVITSTVVFFGAMLKKPNLLKVCMALIVFTIVALNVDLIVAILMITGSVGTLPAEPSQRGGYITYTTFYYIILILTQMFLLQLIRSGIAEIEFKMYAVPSELHDEITIS